MTIIVSYYWSANKIKFPCQIKVSIKHYSVIRW